MREERKLRRKRQRERERMIRDREIKAYAEEEMNPFYSWPLDPAIGKHILHALAGYIQFLLDEDDRNQGESGYWTCRVIGQYTLLKRKLTTAGYICEHGLATEKLKRHQCSQCLSRECELTEGACREPS